MVLFTAISVSVFPSFNAYANESEIIVVISPEAESIPDFVVEQIIAENLGAGVINIHEYGDIIDTNEDLNQNIILNPSNKIINNKSDLVISPMTSMIRLTENIKTTKTVTNSNSLAKDEFKFSVARGEEVTLSFTYSGELKGSIKGKTIKAKELGVEITLKGEYKKGTKYSGPSETSNYNTREFRMKFYEEVGTYVQTADSNLYFSGKLESTTKLREEGTYTKPTKYASYSIDKKIN